MKIVTHKKRYNLISRLTHKKKRLITRNHVEFNQHEYLVQYTNTLIKYIENMQQYLLPPERCCAINHGDQSTTLSKKTLFD